MPQLTRIGAARKLRTRAAKNDCSLPMIAQLLIAIALTIGVSTAAVAEQRTIQALWYTYSHPESHYRRMIERLGKVAPTLPKSAQIRWKISFYWPDWPQPRFERYGVLVIQSGEGFGSHSPKEAPLENVDFNGILKYKAAIEAARGSRTVITGSDVGLHAIAGDSGNAPVKDGHVVRCNPPLTGVRCWDGALGHLVHAVNWAAGGRRMGIVSLVAAEFPGSQWWLHKDSFLRAELSNGNSTNDLVTIFGAGTRENQPSIPTAAQNHPLNAGLTSKGLSNWTNSFHAGFSHSLSGFFPFVNATRYPHMAVAIASERAPATR